MCRHIWILGSAAHAPRHVVAGAEQQDAASLQARLSPELDQSLAHAYVMPQLQMAIISEYIYDDGVLNCDLSMRLHMHPDTIHNIDEC
jgi:hypothetical protein